MSDISFEGINSTLGKTSAAAESAMQSSINTMSTESAPSTSELLAFQSQLQQWSVAVQVESTTTKELGDALKGVIQKAD